MSILIYNQSKSMLKNKKKALALKYFEESIDTPVIKALGTGAFAEELIKKALENGIKIIENKDFFQFESLFKVGSEIPAEVYKIVADILVTLIETNEAGGKWQKSF